MKKNYGVEEYILKAYHIQVRMLETLAYMRLLSKEKYYSNIDIKAIYLKNRILEGLRISTIDLVKRA